VSFESHFSFAAVRRISCGKNVAGAIDVSDTTKPGTAAAIANTSLAQALAG
jgi:hypothetical protein